MIMILDKVNLIQLIAMSKQTIFIGKNFSLINGNI